MGRAETIISQWLQYNLDVDPTVVDGAGIFFDMGLDSLGFIQLIAYLEREHSLDFSPEELMMSGINSLGGLSSLVERKLNSTR